MRTKMTALAAVLNLVLLCGVSSAGFREGVKLEADDKPIDVEIGHLVPCVTDWNDDGLKDMIVGQFSGGKIRLYLNQGADNAPKFKNFTYLEAGGKQISLPAG